MSTKPIENIPLKPLEKLDIVITIFNQEEIIEKVLYGVFRNTTTPFNLALVFDGCTDKTKPRALAYVKKAKPKLLSELIIKDTPNLFELRANNFAFKLAQTNYLITLQDDMVVQEYGWERRLTYPLRKFDDVFAVTGRETHDIKRIGNGDQEYVRRMAFELNTLPRNIFAIRDVINRGPIAFRVDCLRELNYLNDKYAPGALDDYEICLRAWRDKKWKAGAFGINYFSHKAWSKVNAPDSTMKAWDSWRRNNDRIYSDFKEYIDSGIKHDEDRTIESIDYSLDSFQSFLQKSIWFTKYPLRLDKRAMKIKWASLKRTSTEMIKKPFISALTLLFGPELIDRANEHGLKKAIILSIKEKKSQKGKIANSKLMTVCIPTYEMNGVGAQFLKHSLDILVRQTFKDFDIVISDHSKTNVIKDVCDQYRSKLDIHYHKKTYKTDNLSSNVNNAIRKANGKILKILFQDDFLFNENSLQEIVDNFDLKKDSWLVTACEHTKDGVHLYWPFHPHYNDKIHLGENTISSPSVLTIKNDNPLFFDENLKWLMDCDYYKRCHARFGDPKILNTISVVNRLGAHQISNTVANKGLRGSEYRYILKKYHEKELLWEYDRKVMERARIISMTFISLAVRHIPMALRIATNKVLKKRE